MTESHSKQPLISVIMPAYNAERYIKTAIESVLRQTYDNLELIVIDDCSKDGTREIVSGFETQDSRVKLVRNENNCGVAMTRNKGLDLAKGKYIALLDSDDFWHADKLQKQFELAEKTNAGIVYCSYGMIDENGKKKLENFIVPETTDFRHMLVTSVISCSTALLSAEMMHGKRFDPEYYHEDYAMWLMLLISGYSAAGNTEVLAQYRILANSRSNNKFKSAVNRWRIYRDYLKLPFGKSVVYMIKYAFEGLKKYSRKIRE